MNTIISLLLHRATFIESRSRKIHKILLQSKLRRLDLSLFFFLFPITRYEVFNVLISLRNISPDSDPKKLRMPFSATCARKGSNLSVILSIRRRISTKAPYSHWCKLPISTEIIAPSILQHLRRHFSENYPILM